MSCNNPNETQIAKDLITNNYKIYGNKGTPGWIEQEQIFSNSHDAKKKLFVDCLDPTLIAKDKQICSDLNRMISQPDTNFQTIWRKSDNPQTDLTGVQTLEELCKASK